MSFSVFYHFTVHTFRLHCSFASHCPVSLTTRFYTWLSILFLYHYYTKSWFYLRYRPLTPFDHSSAVRGSLLFDDHFRSFRSASPSLATTPYLASSNHLLLCYYDVLGIQASWTSVFRITAFHLSANVYLTVSQVGSRVTLLMEDLQGLRRWFYAWNTMINYN